MHRHFVRCNCKDKDRVSSCTDVSGTRISYDMPVAIKEAKEMIAEGHSNITLSAEILMLTQKEIERI